MPWYGWIFASAVALGVLSWLGPDGLKLLCFPLGLVGLLGIWDIGRAKIRLPGLLPELLGPAAVLGLALFFYGRLLLGDFPVNHDHPMFIFRAWHTAWLIGQGSPIGYSPFMFGGLPANGLYPLGTDLLVGLVKLLSLGWLGWETAYAVALMLFILLGAGSLYLLGRLAAGRLAGTLAGLFWLFDRGAWFQGGWSFSLDWGVWSMGLSSALVSLSLYLLYRSLYDPRRRWWLGLAAAVAAAVLAHPMATPFLALSLPLLLLCEHLRVSAGPIGDWLPRIIGALVLALALCAFWLLPFVARQEWFEPLSCHWTDFPEMLRRWWSGNFLQDTSPWIMMGGLLGLLWGTVRRLPLAFFLLISSALFIFISSDTFLLTFDAQAKIPPLAHLQMERFGYFIRVALLVGTALALAGLVQEARTHLPARPSARRYLLALLAGVALAPLVVFLPRVGPLPFTTPHEPLQWASRTPAVTDLRMAAEYLNRLERGTVGRVALQGHRHDHLLMLLPVYTGLPVFKSGFTPQNNTRFKIAGEDPQVWREAGVTHVLSDWPLGRPGLRQMERFGHLVLYRLEDADPAPVRLEGPGQFEVLLDEPDHLEVQLSGTSENSTLVVRRARYALWRARLDGQPQVIEPYIIGDQPFFMRVTARDGRLELRYRAGLAEWLGAACTLSGLLVLLLVGLRASWPPFARLCDRYLTPWRQTVKVLTSWGALALAAILLLVVTVKLLLPAPSPLPGRRVVDDLSRLLPRARAELVKGGLGTPCQPFDGERLRCPSAPPWVYVGRTVIGADHLMRNCIWLHPAEASQLTVHFPNVRLGEKIEGFFALDDGTVDPPQFGDVDLLLRLDGQDLGRFTCPSRRGWYHWQADTAGRSGTTGTVSVASEAKSTGRRHFCFTAYTTVADD